MKGLECPTKELRPWESATDLNGGTKESDVLLRTVSGGDMEDNLEMNGLKPAKRTGATEQTGHDVMRSQAKAIAVGMRRG